MVIITAGGLQTKEAVLEEVPDTFVAVITKLAVPVNAMFETVTVFPAKAKLMGEPFCVTVIPLLFEIFSTVAVTDATQFSNVTGDWVGEVIVTTGGRTTGHAPLVSPCAAWVAHSRSGILMVCGLAPRTVWQIEIISVCTRGLQINETVCVSVPDALVAVMVKSDAPIKSILEMVIVFPEKLKLMGVPSRVTLMPCWLEIFSTPAVTEAIQFSIVTGEEVGEIILITGGRTVGLKTVGLLVVGRGVRTPCSP